MCGRFSLAADPPTIKELFGLYRLPVLERRFNIAPTTMIPVVRQTEEGRDLEFMRWGLIPSWAKDKKIAYRTINARGETAAKKPAFRSAFKRRRVLILTDGFYEWVKDGKAKLPYRIHMEDNRPFAFAGLWERWTDPETEEEVRTTTIVTTAASERVSAVHTRMPVILDPEHYDNWLNPENQDTEAVQSLVTAYDRPDLVLERVSSFVNNVRNRGPECFEPPTDEGS